MKQTWKAVGTNCNALGILHAHVFGIAKVPSVVPAAAIAPTNQLALKREVKVARSLGYDNSPMRDEAATIANGIPIPSKILPMINMGTVEKGLLAQLSFI